MVCPLKMETDNLKDGTSSREMDSSGSSSSSDDVDFDLATAEGAEEVESDLEEGDLSEDDEDLMEEGEDLLEDVDAKKEPLSEQDVGGANEPGSGGATQPQLVTSGEDKDCDIDGGKVPGPSERNPQILDGDGGGLGGGDTVGTSNQEKAAPTEDIGGGPGGDNDDEDEPQSHSEEVEDEPNFSERQLRSADETASAELEQQAQDDQEVKRLSARVGPEFQAVIPEFVGRKGKEGEEVTISPGEEEEAAQLLWDPAGATEDEVVKFLASVKPSSGPGGVGEGTPSVRDDEHVLSLLLQCQFNFENAKLAYNSIEIITWKGFTDEECLRFEEGLREYGKKFYIIRQNYVSTRTVAELVQFYYLWKKTERYDAYKKESRDLMKTILEDESSYVHYLLRSHSKRWMPSPEDDDVQLLGLVSEEATPISTSPAPDAEALPGLMSQTEEPPPPEMEPEPMMMLDGAGTVVLRDPEGGRDPPTGGMSTNI